MAPIYKIVPEGLWREAERNGALAGAPVDLADGFIHLSTASQVRETARRHFAGETNLLLVAIDPDALGAALRYEPSRGGALFPHLYAPLPVAAVVWVAPLPIGPNGAHVFPDLGVVQVDPSAEGWSVGDAPGFAGLFGPIWQKDDADGSRLYGFLAEERHMNVVGVLHGGMLMSFADEALGRSAFRAQGGRRQVTIQLDTHFVGAGHIGDFVTARCSIVRKTRSLVFMSATLTAAERILSTSTGVWKIIGA